MSDQRLKIAVFIDFDNIEIGVKTTLGRQFDIGAVLEAIKERGEVITKVAYGDWKRAGDYGRAMSNHAVRLVQRVMTPGGDKNGADINLALDALEMAFTHAHINAFVIVGGDSDFITLVEKLKQYDRKVFVVGGRAFTSQVMQKNCTEFIAYENVTGSGAAFVTASGGASAPPAGAPQGRGRSGGRGRDQLAAASSLDAALPLVKRALKVLADREVSPQLGLLKSTLLQLDSSFSERDYGAGTFRDFAEKLEKQGLVTLRHSGRTTTVELADDDRALGSPKLDDGSSEGGPTLEVHTRSSERGNGSGPSSPKLDIRDRSSEGGEVDETLPTSGNVAEGVALIRSILAETTSPPRWPMYVRQLKQFIRNARPDFDEKRYGSILDVMRACQKDGLLRLERDRQGGLRVFASTTVKPSSVPHGWSTIGGPETTPMVEETPVLGAPALPPAIDEEPEDTRGNVAPAVEPKRRARRGTKGEELRTKNSELRTKNEEPGTKSVEGAIAEKPKRVRKVAKSSEPKGKGEEPRTKTRVARRRSS